MNMLARSGLGDSIQSGIAAAAEALQHYDQLHREMDQAARRIQRAWRRVIVDPACAPCRSRLSKEFKECQSLLQR